MIIIYGTDTCGFCKLAQDKCEKFGLDYEYRNITYKKWYNEFRELNVPHMAVPYIIADDKRIGNYERFKRYLNDRLP